MQIKWWVNIFLKSLLCNEKFNSKWNLTLLKNGCGKYEYLIIIENKYIENYNKNNTYKIGISFNPINGNIIVFINDELIYTTNDKSFNGNIIGFIYLGKITVFIFYYFTMFLYQLWKDRNAILFWIRKCLWMFIYYNIPKSTTINRTIQNNYQKNEVINLQIYIQNFHSQIL